MKFKIIFISFNALIVFSFLLIFLLPAIMLGADYAPAFWKESWYIAVIFAVILAVINVVYVLNSRLLQALEQENWSELKKIIENRIFARKRYSRMNIRLYINCCIALSEVSELKKLEDGIRAEKPVALDEWALQLGLPAILSGDPEKIRDYFAEFISSELKDSGWIKWNYCFALLLMKEPAEALPILKQLAENGNDLLLSLAALYLYMPFAADTDSRAFVDGIRSSLTAILTEQRFSDEIEKSKDNVQLIFLSKTLREAMDWLHGERD